MKKILILPLKIVGIIVVVLVVLTGALFGLIHTDSIQQRLLGIVVDDLRAHLHTEVKAERISLSLIGEDVRLYGVEVEDLQHRKMLQLEELGVEVSLWPLLKRELYLQDLTVRGLHAQLYKPSPDSVANFQFIIDAFKNRNKPAPKVPADSVSKRRPKMKFEIGKIILEDIDVTYNKGRYKLGGLEFRYKSPGHHTGVIRDVQTQFVQHLKKGDVDTWVTVSTIGFEDNDGRGLLDIEGLRLRTDNHKPRKNANKPKRGFFDTGHLDLTGRLKVDVTRAEKDSIEAIVSDGVFTDSVSGIYITNLALKAATNKRILNLRDVIVQLPHTTVKFDHAQMLLPSKKEGRKMQFSTSTIKGVTQLRDISRTFAPVLRNFTLPLHLSVKMTGTDETLQFRDVVVNTADKKLVVKANGGITGLKDKYKLNVSFHVGSMHAKKGIAEKIINQFVVRKFMMKQLDALGNISYVGDFSVLWKKEQFSGRLHTQTGNIDFHFALDELNKYVYGTTRTDSFELGKAMGMPDLGKIVCKANFKFDISKPRTAKMRRIKGGKLPIGHVDAEVAEAKYKFVKVRHLQAEINSDGAVANGNITIFGKHLDVLCSFSFTNTNEMEKTKIKPGLRFHKLSDEDRAKKEQLKAEKAKAKAAEKAERNARKAAEKAVKDARKAAEKAERDKVRAAEKAEKEARRAAKKAEKEARKAAKEAAKKAAQEAAN